MLTDVVMTSIEVLQCMFSSVLAAFTLMWHFSIPWIRSPYRLLNFNFWVSLLLYRGSFLYILAFAKVLFGSFASLLLEEHSHKTLHISWDSCYLLLVLVRFISYFYSINWNSLLDSSHSDTLDVIFYGQL